MATIDDQLSAQDVVDTAWSRYTEYFIVDQRTQRVGNRDYIQWKRRIQEFDALYRGDWATVYPDEELKIGLPNIQNLIQTGTDDQARLVSEVQPDIHCPPRSDKDSDIHDARIREAILETYWVKGRGELYIPWLTQDLCATGIALLACVYPTTREGKALRGKYPYPYRLDPRGAFPDVLNGVLQDVIVLQRIRRRQAEAQFGFPLSTSGKDTEDVEVIDYYVKGGMMRVITGVVPEGPIGKPYLYSKVDYGIDCVPVAFSMLPAADGNFRGLYDQAKGPLATQNRLVTLAMEYADQAIYAPWEEFGVTNNMEKPGPNTVYHKIDKDSGMTRVQPAVSSPQLFEWMQLLDQSSRGVIGRPASREGEISQSIASGDFVNATQGALTTQTRFLQRLIGDIRKQWNEVALETDEKVGGSAKKALSRPVGKEYDYVPKKAIGGYRDNSVVYGAGAGLDYINRKQAVLQELGALLISKDTARGMMDDIIDPEGEARKIERESIQDSLVQRVLSSGDTMAALKLLNRVGNGETFADAAGEVAKEMEAAQQQQMMAQQQGAAGTGTQGSGQGVATPPGAETPEAPPAPRQEFQPQVPSESIMVRGA